jgi:hypothetical protein
MALSVAVDTNASLRGGQCRLTLGQPDLLLSQSLLKPIVACRVPLSDVPAGAGLPVRGLCDPQAHPRRGPLLQLPHGEARSNQWLGTSIPSHTTSVDRLYGCSVQR